MNAKIKMVDINHLKLSQIYLSNKKINDILTWFTPSLENFKPISAHCFHNNNDLYITDGHSRVFVAWKSGITQIPYLYDNDEIVTCKLGQLLYKNNIDWCQRFDLSHISKLENRILSENDYESLWRGRCDKMYNLEIALQDSKIDKKILNDVKSTFQKQNNYIYGISEDCKTVYYENIVGDLFETAYPLV